MSKDYTNDIVTHIKNGNIEYLKFNILDKYSDNLVHAITLRHGGVSKPPYDTLNFRANLDFERDNVISNLKILCDKINIPFETICKAKQNHTSNVLVLDRNNKEKYNLLNYSDDEFDAYITKERGICSYITTADCVPIIIYDKSKNIVSNIHSGWRGTVKKIYINAIDKMCDIGCNVEDLIFCIGPSIKKCCFCSSEESFKSNFTSVYENEDEYISYNNTGKFYIDMDYVIVKEAIKRGIKIENIAVCDICTKCNSSDFFSCRAAKSVDTDFGVFATIVNIK